MVDWTEAWLGLNSRIMAGSKAAFWVDKEVDGTGIFDRKVQE